ncbi:hypothetical protein QOT17_017688 [Balamuthia mandrillaris]
MSHRSNKGLQILGAIVIPLATGVFLMNYAVADPDEMIKRMGKTEKDLKPIREASALFVNSLLEDARKEHERKWGKKKNEPETPAPKKDNQH